jgi:regulatory protein
MVRFESADEQAARARPHQEAGDDLAPVTYLPGAGPGMKRRSPLEGRGHGGSPREAPVVALPVGPADAMSEFRQKHDLAAESADAEPDADVEAAAERERAERLLLQRLRGRSLSAAEARGVLRETDVDESEVEEIVERFTELHYIDEVRLADQIIHSHHERKGLGRSGVEAEMRRRKILPDVILEKLEEIPDDEEERATELALKRVQQLERYDEQTIDRRLTGFLMRKGYSSSAVRVAVKAALASRGRGGTSSVRFR